jgi:hypothetical protein
MMQRFHQLVRAVWLILILSAAGTHFWFKFSLEEVQLFSLSIVMFLTSLAGAGYYLLVVYGQPENGNKFETTTLRVDSPGWRTYFLAIFLCALVIIVVNPRGLYGVKLFPQLSNAIKQDKIRYYRQLENDPEVIILGSSRALTLSPAYMEEILGFTTFNFGISGVAQIELVLQGEMITSKQVGEIPKVVVLELSPGNLKLIDESDLAEVPIELWPYMSAEQGMRFLADRLMDLFSGYHFTEALYVLEFTQQERPPQNYWEVSPDGSSRFFPRETLEEALARQLAEREQQNQIPCQNIANDGDRMIRGFAELAVENQFSLVYYYSPIHPHFKAEYLEQSENPYWCQRIF